MWCIDEKGLTGENITQAGGVCAAADREPMFAGAHKIEHITIAPFHNAAGQTTRKQAITHCGALWHPDFVKGFEEAVVACTENGSFESKEFVQFFQEVFIDEIRAEGSGISQEAEVIVLMDSGGGNAFKMHITWKLWLLCQINNIKLFFYRSWHTRALCQSDRRINLRIQQMWSQELANCTHKGFIIDKYNVAPILRYILSPVGAMAPNVIKGSWEDTGHFPWRPSRVLNDLSIFKAGVPEEVLASGYTTAEAKTILANVRRLGKCNPCNNTACKRPVESRFPHCPWCKVANSQYDPEVDAADPVAHKK